MSTPIDDRTPQSLPTITADTVTRDIEVQLEIALRARVEHVAAVRGYGRRDAALFVLDELRGLRGKGTPP